MAKEPVRDQAAGSMGIGGAKTSQQGPVREFITNTRTAEGPRKRNQKGAGGWLISPGAWEPFVDGYRALVAIARPEHLVDGELRRIRVGGFVGDRRVYMWPTVENDVDGIEVRRYHSKIRINIADFLARIKQRPEVGISQRFDLVEADNDSQVQPALMFYLDKPLETAYFETSTKKKKSSSSPSRDTNTRTEATGSQGSENPS